MNYCRGTAFPAEALFVKFLNLSFHLEQILEPLLYYCLDFAAELENIRLYWVGDVTCLYRNAELYRKPLVQIVPQSAQSFTSAIYFLNYRMSSKFIQYTSFFLLCKPHNVLSSYCTSRLLPAPLKNQLEFCLLQ